MLVEATISRYKNIFQAPLFGSTIESIKQERPLKKGESFEGILILPEWGITSIYFDAIGFFALVADLENQRLHTLAKNGDILFTLWNQRATKKSPPFHMLTPPQADSRKEFLRKNYTAKLHKNRHDALTFFNIPEKEQINFFITW